MEYIDLNWEKFYDVVSSRINSMHGTMGIITLILFIISLILITIIVSKRFREKEIGNKLIVFSSIILVIAFILNIIITCIIKPDLRYQYFILILYAIFLAVMTTLIILKISSKKEMKKNIKLLYGITFPAVLLFLIIVLSMLLLTDKYTIKEVITAYSLFSLFIITLIFITSILSRRFGKKEIGKKLKIFSAIFLIITLFSIILFLDTPKYVEWGYMQIGPIKFHDFTLKN